MLLKTFLQEPDVKRAGIRVIGRWKTEQGEYLVLGLTGTSSFPIPSLHHPIEVDPNDPDPNPDLPTEVITSIRRRFGLFRREFRSG